MAVLNRQKFNIVCVPVWCINDGYNGQASQAAAQALADLTWQRTMAFVSFVLAQNAIPVLRVPSPKGGIDAYAEATRQVAITRCYASNFDLIDANATVTDNTQTPPGILTFFSNDNEHLNDVGESVLAGTYYNGTTTVPGLLQICKKYLAIA